MRCTPPLLGIRPVHLTRVARQDTADRLALGNIECQSPEMPDRCGGDAMLDDRKAAILRAVVQEYIELSLIHI